MATYAQLAQLIVTGLEDPNPFLELVVRCCICDKEVHRRVFDARRDEVAAEAFGEQDSDEFLEHLRTHAL